MASWVTQLNPVKIQVELKDVFLRMECQNSLTNVMADALKGDKKTYMQL